ncbi:MAG: SpaA isopeptide-forming pilin-related protein, partial [Eubacteriales bacterium]|nr:SpaA isopeptide-forming pilin-related protein [Eubacteriales bacterium]
TYYLKEISTIKGYNLLKKPVEIEITGAKGQNSYIVDASNAGKKEYTGNLNKKEYTDGKVNLIVNNTSGFQLPATGGIGAGIFAVCGVLVIGAGIAYYVISRKKEKKAK